MKKYILLLPCFLLYGCAINLDFGSAEEDPKPEVDKAKLNSEKIKLPNDIRWIVKSSEYKILCEQTYKNAWANLSEIFLVTPLLAAIVTLSPINKWPDIPA